MTISSVLRIVISKIWVPILFSILAASFIFTQLNTPEFVSNLTINLPTQANAFSLNLNYSNPDSTSLRNNNVNINSMQTMLDTSGYLTNRYQSIDVQAQIAKKMNISADNLSRETPLYLVINQGLGYVNLTYKSNNKSQSEAFYEAVLSTHKSLIQEWNTGKTDQFVVKETSNFPSHSYTISPNRQSQIIPVIASFLFGLLLVIIWHFLNTILSSKAKSQI